MAGESVGDKVGRVRAPRVHITYQVEKGGAMVMKELPFVMGVLGEFSANPKETDKKLKERDFVEVNLQNFDKVLKDMAPQLKYTVPNKLSTDPDAGELRRRNDVCLHPHEIAKTARFADLDGRDVLHRQPHVLASHEELEAWSDSGISVDQRREAAAIERSGNRNRLRSGGRKATLGEHRASPAFCGDGAAIQQRAHLGLVAGVAQNVELFFGAVVRAREAQKLEQERTPAYIGGICSELGAQRRDGVAELTVLK
jgi:hypothetical protein